VLLYMVIAVLTPVMFIAQVALAQPQDLRGVESFPRVVLNYAGSGGLVYLRAGVTYTFILRHEECTGYDYIAVAVYPPVYSTINIWYVLNSTGIQALNNTYAVIGQPYMRAWIGLSSISSMLCYPRSTGDMDSLVTSLGAPSWSGYVNSLQIGYCPGCTAFGYPLDGTFPFEAGSNLDYFVDITIFSFTPLVTGFWWFQIRGDDYADLVIINTTSSPAATAPLRATILSTVANITNGTVIAPHLYDWVSFGKEYLLFTIPGIAMTPGTSITLFQAATPFSDGLQQPWQDWGAVGAPFLWPAPCWGLKWALSFAPVYRDSVFPQYTGYPKWMMLLDYKVVLTAFGSLSDLAGVTYVVDANTTSHTMIVNGTTSVSLTYDWSGGCTNPFTSSNNVLTMLGVFAANPWSAEVNTGKFHGAASYLILYVGNMSNSAYDIAVRRVAPPGFYAFIDATFFNGTHYIDLAGNAVQVFASVGDQPASHQLSRVPRLPANSTWLWVINTGSSSPPTLRFVPAGSIVIIRDLSGSVVLWQRVSGPANAAGLVESFTLPIPPGTYNISVVIPGAPYMAPGSLGLSVYDTSWGGLDIYMNYTICLSTGSSQACASGSSPYGSSVVSPTAAGVYSQASLSVGNTALPVSWQGLWVGTPVASISVSPRYPVYSSYIDPVSGLPVNANYSAVFPPTDAPATLVPRFSQSPANCASAPGPCSLVDVASYAIVGGYPVTSISAPSIGFISDDIMFNTTLAQDGSIALANAYSVYDGAAYSVLGYSFNGTHLAVNATFSGYVFPQRVRPWFLLSSYAFINSSSVNITAVADNGAGFSFSRLPNTLIFNITGSPGISIYIPGLGSQGIAVLVDGRPWTNYSITGNVIRVYSLPGTSVAISMPYIAPSSTYAAPSPLSSNVWELGFIDNNSLANYSFRAGVVLNASNAYLFINASGSISNKSIAFIPSPSDISLMWSCSNNSFTVWLYAVYTWSGYTQYYVDRLLANVPSCPASLYIYYLAYNGSIFLDRVGGTLGDFQRLLTTGELQLSISGPFSPSTIMRYILVDRPLVIEFQPPINLSIYPNPLGQGITLRNMRGWLLSYSVSGVSVSNVQISGSSETISIPIGITLLVFVDPTSRTISLVQAAPPPVVARGAQNPQQPLPLPAPQISMPSISTITDPGIAIPVILGLTAALIIAGRQLTGSIGRGILIATAGMTPLAIALYIVSGNPAYLGLLLTGLALGAAVRFARG
jgi:hypothetical protein